MTAGAFAAACVELHLICMQGHEQLDHGYVHTGKRAGEQFCDSHGEALLPKSFQYYTHLIYDPWGITICSRPFCTTHGHEGVLATALWPVTSKL